MAVRIMVFIMLSPRSNSLSLPVEIQSQTGSASALTQTGARRQGYRNALALTMDLRLL